MERSHKRERQGGEISQEGEREDFQTALACIHSCVASLSAGHGVHCPWTPASFMRFRSDIA